MWLPGSSGMGTVVTWSNESVEATNAMYSGSATTATPAMSTRWLPTLSNGRCSTMTSVLNLAFDEAELEQREGNDNCHQHHRLRGGATQVECLLSVLINLENKDHCRLHRPPVG